MHSFVRINLIVFLFFYNLTQISSQFILYGVVLDSLSSDFLPLANILNVSSGKGTISDQYGRFAMHLNPGTSKIKVSYVGYQDKYFQLEMTKNAEMSIQLNIQSLTEVTIESTSSIKLGTNRIEISPEKLIKVPTIAGEKDIIKALNILPGVVPGVEASNQISVRGGGIDQNLILLDGSILYNTSHLFGYLSSIDPNAIKSINFYKGSFPVEFGGKLSSVLDIRLKEGNRNKNEGYYNIGIISSAMGYEGPIKKDKSSFFCSGRIAYPGLFTIPSQIRFNSNKSKQFFSFYMYDFNLKLSSDIWKNGKILFSIYSGRDYFQSGAIETGHKSKWGLNWGNNIANLRISKPIFKKFTISNSLNLNSFKYETININENITGKIKYKLTNSSFIRDIKAEVLVEGNLNKNIKILGGLSYTLSNLNPNLNFIDGSGDSLVRPSNKIKSSQFSTFGSLNLYLAKNLSSDIGIRTNYFNSLGYKSISWEPRINVKYKFNDLFGIQASFSKMSQPTHLISNPSQGFVSDVWISSSKGIPIQRMKEYSLGMQISNHNLGNIALSLFHRSYLDINEISSDLSTLRYLTSDWTDLLEKNGIGRALGLEFSFSKSWNKISWLTSYTFTNSERKFDNINKGSWYPSAFQRKHAFTTNIEFLKNSKWSFSSLFVFYTGYPITIPKYSGIDITSMDKERIRYYYIYEDRNNARMPSYNRLDINAKKTTKTKKGNTKEWTFGIYNLYGSKNVFTINYYDHLGVFSDPKGNPLPDLKNVSSFYYGFRNAKEGRAALLFIPGISYYYKF